MGTLRVLLALAVVVGHVENFGLYNMMSGGDAVQIFFVISGFYMAIILSKKYNDISLFYSNRFLRLYPTYALVLFATVCWFLIDWVYTGHRPPPFWIAKADAEMPMWQWLALQTSNLTMVGLDVPALFHWKPGQGFLLFHSTEAGPAPDGAEWAGRFAWIGQAWSIGAEIWFYLIAPFLVRRPLYVQILVASSSVCVAVLMNHLGLSYYYFFPANLWFFLLGSILFHLYQSRYFTIPGWCGYLALVYVLLTVFGLGAISNAVFHTVALMLIAMCIPFLFVTFSSKKWDRAIGDLSYPVYLVHMLILGVLAAILHIKSGILGIVGLGLSLLAAAFITRYLDTPIDRFRQKRVKSQFDSAIETMSAAEGGTGELSATVR